MRSAVSRALLLALMCLLLMGQDYGGGSAHVGSTGGAVGGGGQGAGGGGGGLTYVNTIVDMESSNVTTHDVTVTSLSPQENDLMVALLCIDGGGSTAITCPDGWTEWQNQTGNVHGALCAKIATSSESDTTWGSVADQQSVTMTALFRGQDTTLGNHLSDFDGGASASPASPDPAVAPVSGSIVMRAFCADAGKITTDTGYPSSMQTEIAIRESNDGTGSGPASAGLARDADGTGSAPGAATWTDVLSSSDEWEAFTYEVKVAP